MTHPQSAELRSAALKSAGYSSPAAFALAHPGAHCWFDIVEVTKCAVCLRRSPGLGGLFATLCTGPSVRKKKQ